MSEKAKEIIDLRNRELAAQNNVRTLWQDTADYLYPYVNITSTYQSGESRTDTVYAMTPMLDAMDMVSGLKYVLVPVGQTFFAIKAANDVEVTGDTQRYISYLTEKVHEELFQSNFVTEFDEVLRSLIIFGPASIYSEWTPTTGLNYRSQVIGTYQFLEDAKKNVTGIIITVHYTARQAIEEFGEENVSKSIREANEDPKQSNKLFEFIYLCRARQKTNGSLSPRINTNMPFESIIIAVKDEEIIEEGGFEDFPYHSARWMRPANEKDGRGIGTEILPQVKVLNQMMSDFIECGNKWVNPPREILDSFEGEVKVTPGANNYVVEPNSIRALEQGMMGNFPITKEMITDQREVIDRAFFKNVFSPLEGLQGDRRNELEIRERVRGTLPKIGPNVGRIWVELLDQLIIRSTLLLIRNGVCPPPPPELQGTPIKIEYVGEFALALRNRQAKAFQEWALIVGEMAQIFPDAPDNIDSDDAIIRMGETLGVNVEDIASPQERNAKRQYRAEQQAKLEAAQAVQVASQAYRDTSGAAEEGSPAGAITGA